MPSSPTSPHPPDRSSPCPIPRYLSSSQSTHPFNPTDDVKTTTRKISCPTPYVPSGRLVLTETTLDMVVSTSIETKALRLPGDPGVGSVKSTSVVGDVEARRRYPKLPAYLTSNACSSMLRV